MNAIDKLKKYVNDYDEYSRLNENDENSWINWFDAASLNELCDMLIGAQNELNGRERNAETENQLKQNLNIFNKLNAVRLSDDSEAIYNITQNDLVVSLNALKSTLNLLFNTNSAPASNNSNIQYDGDFDNSEYYSNLPPIEEDEESSILMSSILDDNGYAPTDYRMPQILGMQTRRTTSQPKAKNKKEINESTQHTSDEVEALYQKYFGSLETDVFNYIEEVNDNAKNYDLYSNLFDAFSIYADEVLNLITKIKKKKR